MEIKLKVPIGWLSRAYEFVYFWRTGDYHPGAKIRAISNLTQSAYHSYKRLAVVIRDGDKAHRLARSVFIARDLMSIARIAHEAGRHTKEMRELTWAIAEFDPTDYTAEQGETLRQAARHATIMIHTHLIARAKKLRDLIN